MKPSIRHELDRRRLLQYLGNSAIALPFMRTLFDTKAWGATPGKRAVFMYYPDGTIRQHFQPGRDGAISVLPEITAPLMGVKDDIIIPKGIDYLTQGSHEGGARYCLTGGEGPNGRYSIDSYLADTIGGNSLIPALRLGIGSAFQNGGNHISFLSSGTTSVIHDNPFDVFHSIFGNTANPINSQDQAMVRNGKKSILDFALADLQALQNRLGQTEREKLDVHVEAVREIERRLQQRADGGATLPTASCENTANMRGLTVPARETQYPPTVHRNDNFGLIGEIMMDLAFQAMACGVTQVVVLQWSNAVSPTFFNFPGGPGIAREHHDLSHYGDPAGDKARDFVKCQAWFMEKLAGLLERMKSASEGDHNLLYHAAVLAVTEIADGDRHDFVNMPLVLAGQAGGNFRTGQTITTRASHNQLLVSILQALGLPDQHFGNPNLGQGAISALMA